MKTIIGDIRKIYINAKIPFIHTIINIILFLILINIPWYEELNTLLKFWLLFLMPTLIFGLITYLTLKRRISYLASKIISYILILPVLIHYSGVIVYSTNYIHEHGYNKISSYYRIYKNLKDEFKEYLPNNISNNKEVIFHYNPGFLQAGSYFSLYMKTSPEEFYEYQEKFNNKETYNEMSKKFLKPKFEYTPYNNNLPEDFKIYYLNYNCDTSGYCNHGYYNVCALNSKMYEIIFAIEIW